MWGLWCAYRQYKEEDLDTDTLWSAFRGQVGEIKNRVGCNSFGIYEEYQEEGDSVGFSYICAVEVSDLNSVPEGMTARVIPESMYAVFKHDGDASSLPKTLKYIWASWLPKSNYDYVEKPDFELYTPTRKNDLSEKALFLYIPVSEKKWVVTPTSS